MLYKLLHMVFGWDYIRVPSLCGGIFRVHIDCAGNIWVYVSYSLCHTHILRNSELEYCIWLTCHPEKYIKLSEQRRAKKD